MLKKLGLINLRKDAGRVSFPMHLPLGMQTYIMGHSQQQTQQLTSDMAAESKKPDPRCG